MNHWRRSRQKNETDSHYILHIVNKMVIAVRPAVCTELMNVEHVSRSLSLVSAEGFASSGIWMNHTKSTAVCCTLALNNSRKISERRIWSSRKVKKAKFSETFRCMFPWDAARFCTSEHSRRTSHWNIYWNWSFWARLASARVPAITLKFKLNFEQAEGTPLQRATVHFLLIPI